MTIKNSFGSFGWGSVLKLWLDRFVLSETKIGLSGDSGGDCNLRGQEAKKHAANYNENNNSERRITTEIIINGFTENTCSCKISKLTSEIDDISTEKSWQECSLFAMDTWRACPFWATLPRCDGRAWREASVVWKNYVVKIVTAYIFHVILLRHLNE